MTSQRHFTYDARGQVADVEVPGSLEVAAVHHAYDSLGRMIEDKVGVDVDVRHAFSDDGLTDTTTIAAGTAFATTRHAYDNQGRLRTVEATGADAALHGLARYDYGVGVGGPLTLAYANGATNRYSYDDKLRQTGIDVTFGAATNVVTSLHEAFGADSVPRMRQHKIGAKTWTDVFQVDLDGRITGENLRLAANITLPPGEIDNTYVDVAPRMREGTNWSAYNIDAIGNIRKRTTNTSALVHAVDALSRLTAIGSDKVYPDKNDNLVRQDRSSVSFVFDDFTGNMLTSSNGTPDSTSTFKYDALDRRRLEQRAHGVERVTVWDGNVVVAHGVPGNMTLDVPGDDIDEHIASLDQFGSGSQWFYHQGPDQSVLAASGSAGLVEAYTYSAFGELSIWTPSAAPRGSSAFDNIFQYQGHVYDRLTATSSMRARQYQPAWGRLISPDPLGTQGGPSLYAFTGSRPLHNRDPLGLISCQLAVGQCYLDDSERGAAMAAVGYKTTTRSEVIGVLEANGYWVDPLTGEIHKQQRADEVRPVQVYRIDKRNPLKGAVSQTEYDPVWVDTVVGNIGGSGILGFRADQVVAQLAGPGALAAAPNGDGLKQLWKRGIYATGVTAGLVLSAVGAEALALLPAGASAEAVGGGATKVVQGITSRINISTKVWIHIINRHILGTGSKFLIPGSFVYRLLSSPQVVNSPIVRVLTRPDGPGFVREVQMGYIIGFDKVANQLTTILTVITNAHGELETSFPGLLP
jgi:RHS repeat-associated protein